MRYYSHSICCVLFSLFLSLIFFSSCKKNKIDYAAAGYPEEVADILVGSCAVTGCHNAASHVAAAGLNLETPLLVLIQRLPWLSSKIP